MRATVALTLALTLFGGSCVSDIEGPDQAQRLSLTVSGRYGWSASGQPSSRLRLEQADGLLRRVVGDTRISGDDGTDYRIVVDLQPLGQGTVGSIAVTNLATRRVVQVPVAADPSRIRVGANGEWNLEVQGDWVSFYRGQMIPFSIKLSIATTPSIGGPALITCKRVEGTLRISPGITEVPGPQLITYTDPSGFVDCVDSSGRGITSGRFEDATVRFDQLGCLDQNNSPGVGGGRIRWSDGSLSDFTIQFLLTNEGLVQSLVVTSGLFAGAEATLIGSPDSPPTPECSLIPQQQLTGFSLPVTLQIPQAA